MNKTIKTLCCLFISFTLISCVTTKPEDVIHISYAEKYVDYVQTKQYDLLPNLLEEWESEEPNDPEFYSFKTQYLTSKSFEMLMAQGKEPPKDKDTPYVVQQDENGQPIYVSKAPVIFQDKFNETVETAKKGILLYPNRIDLYIELALLYQNVTQYDNAKDVIMEILEQSKKNDMMWYTNFQKPLLSSNRSQKENEIAFIEMLYEQFFNEWFYIGTPTSMKCVNEVYNAIASLFPNNAHIYLIWGSDYLNLQNLKEGESLLLKGREIEKDNLIIIRNLAFLYTILDQNEAKATPYINLLLNSGDEKYIYEGESFQSVFTSPSL